MRTLRCCIGCHDWQWFHAPHDAPAALDGYPIPSKRICRNCGTFPKCWACGKRDH